MCRTVTVAFGNSVETVIRVPSETTGLPSNSKAGSFTMDSRRFGHERFTFQPSDLFSAYTLLSSEIAGKLSSIPKRYQHITWLNFNNNIYENNQRCIPTLGRDRFLFVNSPQHVSAIVLPSTTSLTLVRADT